MATDPEPDGGFLSRWSRRKVQVRQGAPVAEVPPMPAKEARPDSPDRRASAPRVVKLLTFSKSGSQRAQVKKLTIFG
ncbi:hypothetical protein HZU83_12405, partial [Sphaerotilus montanus]|nr:hypothetical protein [Sphaerotilus montanus]